MRAYALIEPGKIEWIDAEEPKMEDDYGAILKPIALAPCSSDVHTIFEGGSKKPPKWIMGHECLGEILEVGCKVKDFKKGDIVLVPSITPNWRDLGIQEGNFTHPSGAFSGMKFSMNRPGVFAEKFYVEDADTTLVHKPEDMSYEAALMCVDVVTTGFTGAEAADIKFGDEVCVVGIGPIGLMAVAGAVLRGASKVYAIGTRPVCVEVARSFGASDIISYKDGDIVSQILERTNNRGVDSVIIAGGNLKTFSDAVYMVKNGTGIVSNINYYVEKSNLEIPMNALSKGMAGKTIRGELCKGGRGRIERLVNMAMCGRIHPEKLVTHTYKGMDKLEEALLLMKEKPQDLIKSMVIC